MAYNPSSGLCQCCGEILSSNDEHEAQACESCLNGYRDIMNSEEARYYGVPYKLQIWSDIPTCGTDGFGEVEVTTANYSTVGFKDPRRQMKHTYMARKDFIRWFSFVRTIY